MTDYLPYPGDPEMEKINNALYQYMYGMRKVFETDQKYLLSVFNTTKPRYQSGLFLVKYINSDPAIKKIFNDSLAHDSTNTFDYSTELAKGLIHQTVGYTPAIYFYNSERAQISNEFYMALGAEADDPDKKPDGNADSTNKGKKENKNYIPAWHFQKNGTVTIELLTQSEAFNEAAPVFIMDIIPDGKYNMPSGGVTGPVPNTIDTKYVHLCQHDELYGDSDLNISYYDYGFPEYQDVAFANPTPSNYIDCCCLWNEGDTFIAPVTSSTSFSYLTFEYDWWAINIVSTFGGQSFDYRATATTDWYTVATFQTVSAVLPNAGSTVQYSAKGNIHVFERN